MIKNFEELITLSKKYGVPKEDILFMDMNLSGLNATDDLDRVRFALKLDINNGLFDLASKKSIENYYFALPVKSESNYQVNDNRLMFKDEMMQAVGTGIAMGRHSEKVGEVASMVTGTVKEEGITMALKKLGLI